MRRSKITSADILFRSVSFLLLLTMLTLWLVIGLYAKYTNSDSTSESARVANGLPAIEIWEHKANLVNGVYVLQDDKDNKNPDINYEEVKENTYNKVIPGVDIAKDPYITLNGESEVDFWLYVKITEENFPPEVTKDSNEIKIITYELNDKDKWTFVEELSKEEGVYVYRRYFDAGSFNEDVNTYYILKDNKLIVSQYFDGSIYDDDDEDDESVSDGYKFKLTFEAWAEQAD